MDTPRRETGERATRTVLLRHELPDGTWHFDWMIERSGGDERRLLTFRVRDRVDRDPESEFRGERLGDHRATYLDFEGDVPGGRGRVSRVASGWVSRLIEGDGCADIRVDFGAGEVRWSGRRTGSAPDADVWVFSRTQG